MVNLEIKEVTTGKNNENKDHLQFYFERVC